MDPTYLASLNNTYELELLNNEWQMILIVWYSSTAILSLISNVLAIFILIKCDRFMSEIWKYLVNLSIADILMAMFSIPFTYTSFMLGQWIFPSWLCPFIQSVQLCSVYVSVYTLAVIGFDRYFAIIHPFNHPIIYLKTHRLNVIITIWITGILFSIIQLMQTRAVPFRYGDEILFDCKELWNQQQGRYYTIFLFILTFGLPISILIFVYASIGIHLWYRKMPGNPEIIRDSVQWQQKIRVIKMLIMIVIIFVVCWLPIHIHSFIVWFHPIRFQTYIGYMSYVISFFICHWLAMAHSFLNPFIYGFMSENFKTNFHRLFCMNIKKNKKKKKKKHLLSTNTIECQVGAGNGNGGGGGSNAVRMLGVVITDDDNNGALCVDDDNIHIAELDNLSTTNMTTTNMMITESIISSSYDT
ncbi:myokinin receptor-like protein [Dermatophagoides farinae]|uniref:Myokinin receptor-like protein n=2 Tax=Dermatophagoides farinae TaxID=6954 RepID=A0A9D4NSU1_DERFA|nr:myokinin receptor-like protein [Dermatophagoides farinae]